MSLLLLFRPSVGGSDQTVTHTAGILALRGGTHAATYGGQVTATPGIMVLVGGTHTATYGGAVTLTAGVLSLTGGTHLVEGDPVEAALRERAKTGTGL